MVMTSRPNATNPGPCDYDVPTGDFSRPGTVVPMPVPVRVDIVDGQIGHPPSTEHSTQNTSGNPRGPVPQPGSR